MKISVEEAAKMMGLTPRYIRYGLRQDKFPFGFAVEMDGRWSYYVNKKRLELYLAGADLDKPFDDWVEGVE